MSDQSKKFVPFSIATNQFRPFGAGPQIDPGLVEQPEPDYKGQLKKAEAELSKLRQEVTDLKKSTTEIGQKSQTDKADFDQFRLLMEGSAKGWIQEVRESTGQAIISALNQILQMKSSLDLALTNRIVQALNDLAEKKAIRVQVAPNQVDTAKKLLKDTPMWEVVVKDDVRGGAIFQLEKEKWDTTIQIAIEETMQIIEAWIAENG